MKKSRSRAQERRFWGKIFTFPSFIVVCLFAFYPVFRTLYLSFCEYNFGFDASPVFIGVENYVRMFSDSKFLLALENTASYAVIDFILMLVLSLAIALLLFFKGKHTWFFRTAVFTPIVVPISLTCILFRNCQSVLVEHLGHATTRSWLADRRKDRHDMDRNR